MATTQIEEAAADHTACRRRNEILAISFSVGLLLALCLVSAAFYPNDPSWNSVGQHETQNWAGSSGANVAATVFQFIGIAGYLLPLLLFAAAWRRFRTRSIQGPFTRIIGLVVLVVAASALLSISQLRPVFDSSVRPGGLLGAVVAEGLASGLNRIGATVVLVAIGAMGLLLQPTFLSFDSIRFSRGRWNPFRFCRRTSRPIQSMATTATRTGPTSQRDQSSNQG